MLTALLSASELALFQHHYTDTRQQFLAAANNAPRLLYCNAHELPVCAPDDSALFTDCAWIGSDGAKKVLVVISGTHGVEGFTGSAIQADFLQQLTSKHWQLADDTAVLLIHGLNAWGMAWLRRCEQTGVDLNRNFIDFENPLPLNPGYSVLRDALMQSDKRTRAQTLQEFATRHSQTELEVAISGGQYEDPKGPFFGGTGPTFARSVIESLINEHVLGEKRLAVIDLHTGLGPYGYGEIICDHQPESHGAQTAQHWYGDSVTLPFAGTSSSVPKLGLLDYAWHAIMKDESCFVTLEFGTYSVESLFNAILLDHQVHAAADFAWSGQATRDAKKIMLSHFYPADDQWREMVLLRARQVIRLALEGLQK